MATNFPANPSNGDTHAGFTYNSAVGAWESSAIVTDTASVTTYATANDLPLSNNTTGDQAFVTATNRLYLWNGTGWYNIALINTTPSISGVNSSYEFQTDGTPIEITITATDPEGLPITYSIASDTSGSIATVTQGTGANTNIFTITPSTNDANAGTFSLTFRASDGVNIATAAASFELAFRVVNSNYTTALITSVGTNNATNSLVADNSTNDYGFALYGTNSTQGTFSPYRHGGYSTYFDGTGDNLTTSSAILSTSGGFTVQCWVYLDDTSNAAIWAQGTSGNAARASLSIESGNWYAQIGSAVVNTTAAVANVWKFLEFQYNGSQIELFVDGTSVGTASNTTNAQNTGLFIGKLWASNYDFQGYISDLRVIDGTPSGSSSVPTERLTAITNTSLLSCHLPYIADGSTNSHTITVNGNTKTEPFAPYDSQEYSAADHGSSYYLGGLGNHVAATSGTGVAAPGSGDFCLEFWVYPTIDSTLSTLVDYRPQNSSPSGLVLLWRDTANKVYLFANGSQRILSNDIAHTNVWTHVALVRNSGTHYLYINGKQQTTTWADSSTWGTNSSRPILMQSGYHYSGNSPGNYYNTTGNMTDVRLVTGSPVYTTDFTPPTTPLTAITNTQLLLNAERAGIIDKSQSVQTLTLNGDLKSSTTQSKYLSSSMYFDGNGDLVILKGMNETFDGDFTVEGWYYFNTYSSSGVNTRLFASKSGNANAADNFQLIVSRASDSGSGGAGTIAIYNNGYLINGSTAGVADSSWHHIAVTREGTSLKLFVDGTQTSSTATTSQSFTFQDTRLGARDDTADTISKYTGYMSDVRITKGLARYTANFTPPTAELKG